MTDQIICLSDTDDELLLNKDRNIVVNDVDQEKLHTNDSDAGFDFPPVNFHYSINKSTNVFESSKRTNKISDKLDVFDSAVIDLQNYEFNHENVGSEVRSRGASPEKRDFANVPSRTNETNKRKKAPRTKNTLEEETERTRTKENAAFEKRLKELERRNRKNIQPGECLKFMTVNLDKDLEHNACSLELIDVLRNYEISWNFDSQPIPNSVTWTRRVENYRVNDKNEICEESIEQRENQIVVIWNWEEAVQKIKDKTFVPSVTSMASIFPKERLSLIIYGMENYFERYKKSKKQKSDKNDPRRVNGTSNIKISQDDLELCLAEVQLILRCNSTLVETPQELAMLIYRYTKSIAEIPLKMERRQKIVDKMDWYAMGDNRDTVKVDKNGNGLKRLWQQQLCQFNLAGLETAEAICSVYSSPWDLMHVRSEVN